MARKEKMKVYHGIPKYTTDKNTVFYASFDGNINSEPGLINPFKITNFNMIPAPTGYGLSIVDPLFFSKGLPIPGDNITIDFWTNLSDTEGDRFTLYDSSIADPTLGRSLVVYYHPKEGLKFTQMKPNSNIQIETYNAPNTLNIGWTHIRMIISNRTAKLYLNCKLIFTSRLLQRTFDQFKLGRGEGYGPGQSPNISISDLHIYNIDKGNHFPNLPQDFIEGKAIIVPPLTQQQIKGDPIYSQVTEIVVPPFSDSRYEIINGGLNERLKSNPEITTKTSSNWSNGGFVKIKGLTNEIISGVIDTDTALAKIPKPSNDGLVIPVNTTDGLTVQDTIVFIKFSTGYRIERVITSIDHVAKTITVNSRVDIPNNSSEWLLYTIIETTASSSSPLVKVSLTGTSLGGTSISITLPTTFSSTDDFYNLSTISIVGGKGEGQVRTITDYIGNTKVATMSAWEIIPDSTSVFRLDNVPVVGTWSGLGSNEAMFNIGSNTPSLEGKNLYITYGLNIPGGNSCFPELPYNVDGAYNESGIEMKPVSEIIIEDDYINKIKGSNKECPHESKWLTSSMIRMPYDEAWEEIIQSSYSRMSKMDSSILINSTEDASGQIPQQLFTFNLIEIIERKIGKEIPHINKVEWLKDNISEIYFKHTGYGTNPSGAKLEIRCYSSITKSFNTWVQFHSYPTVAPSGYGLVPTGFQPSNAIDLGGLVHFIITSLPSDETTASEVATDYVSLEVKLKTDPSFTILYCSNNRSREDSCNPVLIQKETKTVKRYVPSNETFVTECRYDKLFRSKIQGTGNIASKGLLRSNYVGVTNYGTNEPRTISPGNGDKYGPLICRLPLNSLYKPHMFTRERLPHRYADIARQAKLETAGKLLHLQFPIIAEGPHYASIDFHNLGRISGYGDYLDSDYGMAVRFISALVLVDGEILLKIRTVVPNTPELSSGVQVPMGANYDAEALYSIPNRPLIK